MSVAVIDDVQRRKGEHLEAVAGEGVETSTPPGWADVRLVHHALPRTDLADVDVSTGFLGRRLRLPLVIAGMTGGHPRAREINATLARAARRHGVAMGVGSQRAALQDPSLAATYAVARSEAPDTFLIGNLGAAQLVPQRMGRVFGGGDVERAVRMIDADAIAIHLNFLEESVQPEGDRRAAGLRGALARVAERCPVPTIAKETGAGLSRPVARELAGLGFRALDVGGLGGTSFAAVEASRARRRGDERGIAAGRVFREWGIPTAVSVVEASGAGVPVIATGGVRSGLDAAKAIALGAHLVGVARPLLLAAMDGDAAVDRWMMQFAEELRIALFLAGCASLADLRRAPRVVVGDVRAWLEDLRRDAPYTTPASA